MLYYGPHFTDDTDAGRAVRRRLDELFPKNLRAYDTEESIAEVERRRVFPLCYETDTAQRAVPQRVMGWPVPIADNGLMTVYQKMSSSMKLHRSLFAKIVRRICGDEICRIPDANTGAPIGASLSRTAINSHLRRLKSKMVKLVGSIATTKSWPSWRYYVVNSPRIKELWQRPNPDATVLFRKVLGRERFSDNVSDYRGPELWLFVQLLTLKLWLDERA